MPGAIGREVFLLLEFFEALLTLIMSLFSRPIDGATIKFNHIIQENKYKTLRKLNKNV